MAITSWPFENADTTEVQYSRLFRLFQDPGVVEGLAVSANSSGMRVFLSAGAVQARGFYLQSTAQEERPVAPAGSSLRTDLAVARISPTANTATLAILAGPGGTALPTITQTEDDAYDVVLAVISVRGGTATIAPGDVVDVRTYVSTHVRRWTSTAQRPAATAVPAGTIGFNIGRGVFEVSNGSIWSDLIKTLSVADVTGLVTALAGKAPTSHTHTAAATISGVFDPARIPRRDYHHRDSGTRTLAGGASDQYTITMPNGRFTSPPVAQANADGQGPATGVLNVNIGTAATDSVTVTVRNNGSGSHTFRLHVSVSQVG